MEINSKYNLGDIVFQIINTRERKWISCGACEGIGRIVLAGKKIRHCPDCCGERGVYVYFDTIWRVTGSLTIGQIRTEITATPGIKERRSESYMCIETGIGTGTIHSVKNLFPTKEAAQKECDKRNLEAKGEKN